MTATPQVSRTPTNHRRERLGDRLKPIHRRWLRELHTMLGKVEGHESDIWPRWNAIRYVDTVFSSQFDRERSVVEKLSQTFDGRQVTRLWVAGELVAMVRWQLCHSVGLCHHAGEFSNITARLVRAVEHWFSEVEEIVGPLSWAELPSQTRHELASIDGEKVPPWSDLPTSLATSL